MQTRRINKVHFDSWGCRFVRWGARWRCSGRFWWRIRTQRSGSLTIFPIFALRRCLLRQDTSFTRGGLSPIIGWQLYLAAIFIKLFGFSFTTTRASIMFVAVVTAYLCQRTLVRAGINEWNASIGTLTLMLSPLVMPLEVTYMTDIPGLFAIILCLYACLRGIQSGTSRGAIAWIGFAALSNVVFGSARQIAWLGALVMVPSALWILRGRRGVLVSGIQLWIVACSAHLRHQPLV